MTQSKFVQSNQDGIHPDLEWAVMRHMAHPTRRPIAEHTRIAFDKAMNWLKAQEKPLILDTGCGTGISSILLAQANPEKAVIGIDKSEVRLQKASALPENCMIVRAELQDFWMLMVQENIACERQYLLYPNPWPKAHDFMRRWQGHPVFPYILKTSTALELRTNWKIYAEEFAKAYSLATGTNGLLEEFHPDPEHPLTAFEKKYLESGHCFWRFTG